MKTIIVGIFASLILTASSYALEPDISVGTITLTGPDAFHIEHLTISGFPGTYWVDFIWDPTTLSFVPTSGGEEAQPIGSTWSWLMKGTFGNSSYAYRYYVTPDPINRIFYVSFEYVSGSPFICHEENFIQGNNQFDVAIGSYDNNSALITYTSSFDGCWIIYSGQTVTATISNIPMWFDFSKSFMVGFDGPAVVCEPDGTVRYL